MMVPTQTKSCSKLFDELKRLNALSAAWSHVRARARGSSDPRTKQELAVIERDPLGYLRRIQRDLSNGAFQFDAQRAVLKRRAGKDPRGIVVAPLRNRIVQRAILEVCQSERRALKKHLGQLLAVLRTRTSVGGLPERGVVDALRIIREAIDDGTTHFVRSDIKNFFVNVRKADVHAFLDANVRDQKFLTLMKKGLETELANASDADIRHWWRIFPDDDKGVPQGSSLSALCANITLARLDQELNGRGVTTVRYLDDFLILAPSARAARMAWASAQGILEDLGLEAHDPDGGTSKAAWGKVSDGFEFLSFRVDLNGIAPTAAAKREFLAELKEIIRQTKRSLFDGIGDPRRSQVRFVQSLALLDSKIRGWGDAFREADQRLAFSQMDVKISQMIESYIEWFLARVAHHSPTVRRRIWGVALLVDTPPPTISPPY
jgi:RNA-directed DNA polymerase